MDFDACKDLRVGSVCVVGVFFGVCTAKPDCLFSGFLRLQSTDKASSEKLDKCRLFDPRKACVVSSVEV